MNGPQVNLTPYVTEKFITAAPAAAARALEALPTHEAVLLLKPLKAESVIACLEPMDPLKAAAALRRLPSRQAAYVLGRLSPAQGARIFAAFSAPQREKMKTLLSPASAQLLESAKGFPEGSAGAKMSTDTLCFRTETPLLQMVEKLKTLPRKKLPAACFVTAKDSKLRGFIRTAELCFYGAESTAGSIMNPPVALRPEAGPEEARKLAREHGVPLVAVTDAEGLLLGALNPFVCFPVQPPKKKRFGWF